MPTRRTFLRGAGATALLPIASPAIVSAATPVDWKLASQFSPVPAVSPFAEAQYISDRVAAATGGEFDISLFGGGSLVSPAETLNAVRTGLVECGQIFLDAYYAENEAFLFGAGVPFGLNAAQFLGWWNAAGHKHINGILEADNVFAMPCGDLGKRTGGWYRDPLKGKASLQGLKIRIHPPGTAIFTRLGAVPVAMPAGEIYPALAAGIIDAADYMNLSIDRSVKFHEVAPNVYADNPWQPNRMVVLVVNKTAWDALPTVFKNALSNSCAKAHNRSLRRYRKSDKSAKKALKKQGAAFLDYPKSIEKRLRTAANTEMKLLAQSNPDFKKAWKAFKRYKKKL